MQITIVLSVNLTIEILNWSEISIFVSRTHYIFGRYSIFIGIFEINTRRLPNKLVNIIWFGDYYKSLKVNAEFDRNSWIFLFVRSLAIPPL